jgi:hypothetical protein
VIWCNASIHWRLNGVHEALYCAAAVAVDAAVPLSGVVVAAVVGVVVLASAAAEVDCVCVSVKLAPVHEARKLLSDECGLR